MFVLFMRWFVNISMSEYVQIQTLEKGWVFLCNIEFKIYGCDGTVVNVIIEFKAEGVLYHIFDSVQVVLHG